MVVMMKIIGIMRMMDESGRRDIDIIVVVVVDI